MPKEKTQSVKKKAQKKTPKKRSQKVNSLKRMEADSVSGKKVICSNMECKLRRAGCYGYEACPGFMAKS